MSPNDKILIENKRKKKNGYLRKFQNQFPSNAWSTQ